MARVHVDSAVTSRDDDLIAVYESTRLGRWADRFVGARCGLSLRRYGLSYEFFGGPRKRVLNPGSSERAHTAQVVRVARQGVPAPPGVRMRKMSLLTSLARSLVVKCLAYDEREVTPQELRRLDRRASAACASPCSAFRTFDPSVGHVATRCEPAAGAIGCGRRGHFSGFLRRCYERSQRRGHFSGFLRRWPWAERQAACAGWGCPQPHVPACSSSSSCATVVPDRPHSAPRPFWD